MDNVSRLLSFSGRTARLHYWQIGLALQLLVAIPFCLFLYLAITLRVGALAGVGLIPIVLALPASMAVTFRRLHDRNRSAWWYLLFFGPLVAVDITMSVARTHGDAPSLTFALLALLSLIPWLWGNIELGFLRGSRGPNRFGPDPYAASHLSLR